MLGIPEDLVVGVAAPSAGDLEAVADLDALHRLDAHERLGEQPVDLAVPVHVRAEADRHTVAEHLDDPAERVADLRRRLHRRDHRGLGRGVEAPHRRLVDAVEIAGPGSGDVGADPGVAHLDDVTDHGRPEGGEERLGHRARRDPRRGLAGARPFEHVAGVVEAVLLHPDQVGVAGARAR